MVKIKSMLHIYIAPAIDWYMCNDTWDVSGVNITQTMNRHNPLKV